MKFENQNISKNMNEFQLDIQIYTLQEN